MTAIVQEKFKDLVALCHNRGVRRLALFGSAASAGFDPASSDLDFLVEFQPVRPAQHADNFFGLQEDLEGLLGGPIELIEPGPIRNPYFRQAIEKTQIQLYVAA